MIHIQNYWIDPEKIRYIEEVTDKKKPIGIHESVACLVVFDATHSLGLDKEAWKELRQAMELWV